MQTCVSAWQEVKFGFGSEAGHRAVAPLHFPSSAHSDTCLQLSSAPLKVHSPVQHGPWLGLQKYRINSQTNVMLLTTKYVLNNFKKHPKLYTKMLHVTCRFCQVGVCIFCPPLHWRCSSRSLYTDHCSRSRTVLQLPQAHYHR